MTAVQCVTMVLRLARSCSFSSSSDYKYRVNAGRQCPSSLLTLSQYTRVLLCLVGRRFLLLVRDMRDL